MTRELRISDVARLIDVAPDLIRKWKARGLLTLAPGGVAGQGRGNECSWSLEAVDEVRRVAASRMPTKARIRGARS